MNYSKVGNGKVVLIAGGGKVYTDIAAKFCRSEKDIESIISSQYNKKLVKAILNSGHLAATEFDYFIFGVQGYSRVTEVQLVRKRLASYMIKSGRNEENGKRSFSVVLPKDEKFTSITGTIQEHAGDGKPITLDTMQILNLLESWYDNALKAGIKEEDARYLKPQATEMKAIIGMNAHALRDWFKIRCCFRAQSEIRDLANKMLKLCKEAAPDLFEDAGPSCVSLGMCPEMAQCEQLKGKVPSLNKLRELKKEGKLDNLIKELL